jgi:hypothetical protein
VSSPTPEQLRARAVTLRNQARSLDSCKLLKLHLRAGPDVWIGPTATLFCADIGNAANNVRIAAQELRDAARALDQQALATESAGVAGNRTGAGF